MKELREARKIIDEADRKLSEAFEMRFRAVKDVLRYKEKNGLPVYDEEREKEVIRKGLQNLQEEELKPYYEKFLRSMMEISKEYQEDCLKSKEKEPG